VLCGSLREPSEEKITAIDALWTNLSELGLSGMKFFGGFFNGFLRIFFWN
jgi:hypothetical protein